MTPIRSRSASALLYSDRIYVFSDMLVNRLGNTPLRLIAKQSSSDVRYEELGRAIRHAIDDSIPWVEWEEFEREYDKLGDPITQALGIPNDDLGKAQRKSGSITVADWPNKTSYVYTKWVRKGLSGKPLENNYPPLAKDCSDEQLGEIALKCLQDSLEATLMANKKPRLQ